MGLFRTPKRISSDEELEQLSKNDDYARKKIIADATTLLFLVLIGVFGVLVIYWLFNDQDFRDVVKTTVLNNLVGIVIAGFAIIGLSVNNRK